MESGVIQRLVRLSRYQTLLIEMSMNTDLYIEKKIAQRSDTPTKTTASSGREHGVAQPKRRQRPCKLKPCGLENLGMMGFNVACLAIPIRARVTGLVLV